MTSPHSRKYTSQEQKLGFVEPCTRGTPDGCLEKGCIRHAQPRLPREGCGGGVSTACHVPRFPFPEIPGLSLWLPSVLLAASSQTVLAPHQTSAQEGEEKVQALESKVPGFKSRQSQGPSA